MQTYLYIVLVPVLTWLAHKALRSKRRPYPPGPWPKPLIANLLDMPQKGAPTAYLDMGKKYNSDIIHLEVMGYHFVILNKLEDAEELLEKRAKIYSDRPVMPILKLMGWEYNVAIMPHGEEWRQHRKVSQQHFRAAESVKFLPTQTKKVRELLKDLASTPEKFQLHSKKLSIAIPLSTMYGYDITSLDDPCIAAAEESIALGAEILQPGNNFINMFPIIGRLPTWFPGTKAVRKAAEVKRLTEEMRRIPLQYAKSKMASTASPSFVTEFLEKKWRGGASEEEEAIVENIAYTVYGAASDTTISATGTFFYLMATNPDVQRKAQAEIDLVVGSRRLPDIDDRPNMPFLEALYREVMRLGPPLPLGLIHMLTEDDHYKGYFLPKGKFWLHNLLGMNHNEEKYVEPSKFRPERFLDESGKPNEEDRVLAYGFGRRFCVGKHIASSTMWLIMASVLACFNIGKAKDAQGKEIEVDDSFEDDGLLRHRRKFQCSFTVRSPEAYQLIAQSTEDIA
ncbi:cytochrome P450 [Agrocybe pediades]|nr:cytochrome P450 [Agrocybe pediades]